MVIWSRTLTLLLQLLGQHARLKLPRLGETLRLYFSLFFLFFVVSFWINSFHFPLLFLSFDLFFSLGTGWELHSTRASAFTRFLRIGGQVVWVLPKERSICKIKISEDPSHQYVSSLIKNRIHFFCCSFLWNYWGNTWFQMQATRRVSSRWGVVLFLHCLQCPLFYISDMGCAAQFVISIVWSST